MKCFALSVLAVFAAVTVASACDHVQEARRVVVRPAYRAVARVERVEVVDHCPEARLAVVDYGYSRPLAVRSSFRGVSSFRLGVSAVSNRSTVTRTSIVERSR